jgi:general secretion pathway protein D
MLRVLLLSTAILALVGCKNHDQALEPLPQTANDLAGAASPRVNGVVTLGPGPMQNPEIAEGRSGGSRSKGITQQTEAGDVMLNFADTDVKEVIRQIMGDILHLNYVVDPAVAGTVTLETHQPVQKSQLLNTLETLLNQNGATLTQSGGLYRVIPSAVALTEPSMAGDTTFGSQVEELHYTSARDLARVMQPFVGDGARVIADPSRNALLISGEPAARATIVSMVHAFDTDLLANQSYALFPVTSDDPGKVATDLQKAFQTEGEGALSGLVRIIPMERVNAVLVVSPQRKYIDDARRLFALVDRARRTTARTWHVYYVQNGDSGDLANMLQRAFNPKEASQEKSTTGSSTAPGHSQAQIGENGGQSGFNNNNSSQGGTGGASGGIGSSIGGGVGSTPGSSSGNGAPGAPSDSSGTNGSGSGGGDDLPMPVEETDSLSSPQEENTNTIRIIPNHKNNAILYFATAEEAGTIEGMMRKIDVVPLQVRIDATIAEVTLNDNLKYGTQFYFQNGGLSGLLTNGTTQVKNTPDGSLPGFILSKGTSAVHATISALQAVTDVRVLSSPQLLVLDNQMARLQVGDNVPYLTQSAQSTITDTAAIVNSVAYQETGVILQVVPKVNSGGLVTLDVSQEVSDVATTASSSIDSPTFSERKVRSHVVVQDGQTVGLAGLISDNVSRGNAGIPYLKDIPVIGSLFGTQTNTRMRTELLILITPHVLQDQRDARSLTQDLREKLHNAGLVPQELQALPRGGSENPNAALSRP